MATPISMPTNVFETADCTNAITLWQFCLDQPCHNLTGGGLAFSVKFEPRRHLTGTGCLIGKFLSATAETRTGSFQHLVLGHFDQEALNISETSPSNGYAVPLHLNWRAFWSLNGYAEMNRTRILLLYEIVTKRLFWEIILWYAKLL